MPPFRPKTILAISSAGVGNHKNPSVMGYAWARTDSPVFTPQVRKFYYLERSWKKVLTTAPRLSKVFRNLVGKFGKFDLVVLDHSPKKGTFHTQAAGMFVLGLIDGKHVRYVKARVWSPVFLGPYAGHYLDDDKFDDTILELTRIRFPWLQHIVTCPQPARALGMLYWAAARFCNVK